MMRIHPRDEADFLRFIDREWKNGEPPSFMEYRFNANRQRDWIRVRHTASCTPRGEDSVLSCLIENLPLTSTGGSPLEKMEDELKGAEVELLRFVESALDLRIEADPVPRLELLQRAIGADVMVLVHFGSKVIVTDALPLSWDQSFAGAEPLTPLIEGVSGWDLAKELHQHHPALGILLTSGYDGQPEEHGLNKSPRIAFLQKPYEVRTLKATLSRLIKASPQTA